MSREYTITSFNEQSGQIVAYVDGFPAIAIDLPIIDGAYPIGDELDSYVLGFFPPKDTTREQALLAGVANTDVIAARVQPSPAVDVEAQEQNTLMLAQARFESQVAKALVKFGVLEVDPTATEDTQL